MGVDRSLRVFILSAYLLSLFVYICVCVIRSIYTYTQYQQEKNSKLVTNIKDKTKNGNKKKEIEIYRTPDYERQQRMVLSLGKKKRNYHIVSQTLLIQSI